MPVFIPPPEAPVFEPKGEDFKDPLAYIAKIRPIAEKYGICKIRPPSDWRPPFSVDVSQFRFTPRVQKLNELEATTRVKLNFEEALAKYWDLQGTSMRHPTVEGTRLDLLKLSKIVEEEEGGYEQAVSQKRWTQIASKMGFTKYHGLGSCLKSHYEKLLLPYRIFKDVQLAEAKAKCEQEIKVEPDTPTELSTGQNGASDSSTGQNVTSGIKSCKVEEPCESGDNNREDGNHAGRTWVPSTSHGKSPSLPDRPTCTVGEPTPRLLTKGSSITTRRSRRMAGGVDPQITLAQLGAHSRELQRLQFLSPGPKILEHPKNRTLSEGANAADGNGAKNGEAKSGRPMVSVTKPDGTLDVDSIVCYQCHLGDGEESMLLCDVCNASYHTYCLVPPLRDVPPGDWRCPTCVAKECNKPQEAFGFEQADKVYTLHTFQTFANRFKGNYFGNAPHLVPMAEVEQEFWRLVHSLEDDITVEYGADLHSSDHGSGFPLDDTGVDENTKSYVNSGWNLNNLPNLDASVLRHITADISGMKVPWLYVGMCFSSFCWHNEDHWSYSINYLHWGESKTWYGVPGASAPAFEKAMVNTVPELFQETPDLLHHLVTLISPNVLMKHNVPVVRTNQHAGEFVVTFPRAYHAGFNQGYNFAEAVNFCPADWIPHGRACMTHYQQLHRYTVFAHDELVCKMAMMVDKLDEQMSAELHKDMTVMVEQERELRRSVREMGVEESVREAFELLPDDERQCRHCQALCFLSAVTCSCSPGKLVCLQHADQLCSCPSEKHCLRYRYTLAQLPAMLLEVENRAQRFIAWERQVQTALKAEGSDRPTLLDLKSLIKRAHEGSYSSGLIGDMEEAIAEADRCSLVATQLVSVRPRTRRGTSDPPISKEEFDDFVSQVEKLHCRIDCTSLMKLRDGIDAIEQNAKKVIAIESCDVDLLNGLLQEAYASPIEISCLPALHDTLRCAEWITTARHLVSATLPLDHVQKHVREVESLTTQPSMDHLINTLKNFEMVGTKFEDSLKKLIQSRPSISELEEAIREANLLPVSVPLMAEVRSALKSAIQWTKDATAFMEIKDKQDVERLDSLISRAHQICVSLPLLSSLEQIQDTVKTWRLKLQAVLTNGSTCNTDLIPLLYPRTDILHRLDARQKAVNISQRRRGLTQVEEKSLILDLAASELEHMRKVRARHLLLYNQDCTSVAVTSGRYCHCHMPLSGVMMRCELCLNYYHHKCLKEGEAHDRYSRLICSLCSGYPKPSLAKIGEVYASMRSTSLAVPESAGLLVLLQRAILWQIQARFSLSAVLELFSHHNPQVASNLRAAGLRSFTPSPEDMNRMMLVVAGGTQQASQSDTDFKKRPIDSHLADMGLRCMEKYVINALSNQQPQPVLSAGMCAHLEELLLMGDLLQVRMEESDFLWLALKANHQQMNNIRVEAPTVDPPVSTKRRDNDQESPKKKRKRKSYDGHDGDTAGVDDEVCKAHPCKRPSKNCAEVEWVQCDDCNFWYHLLCIDLPPHVAHSLEKFSCFRCEGKSKFVPPPQSCHSLAMTS